MMVEVTYQMVLSTLQTAGLLVSIFYYIMVLRNQQKNQEMQLETRQAQLFMQIYSNGYNTARAYWDRMKDYYAEYRVRHNAPMVAEWIEYLYNIIKPIMEAQHPEMKEKVFSEQI